MLNAAVLTDQFDRELLYATHVHERVESSEAFTDVLILTYRTLRTEGGRLS